MEQNDLQTSRCPGVDRYSSSDGVDFIWNLMAIGCGLRRARYYLGNSKVLMIWWTAKSLNKSCLHHRVIPEAVLSPFVHSSIKLFHVNINFSLESLSKLGTMQYRTLVMYMEIGCFVSCLSGWILICSTLPTEYWTFSEVGSVVLTTSNYYSNLWMDCISDTTGVSDCKYYPSLLALPGKKTLYSCWFFNNSFFFF